MQLQISHAERDGQKVCSWDTKTEHHLSDECTVVVNTTLRWKKKGEKKESKKGERNEYTTEKSEKRDHKNKVSCKYYGERRHAHNWHVENELQISESASLIPWFGKHEYGFLRTERVIVFHLDSDLQFDLLDHAPPWVPTTMEANKAGMSVCVTSSSWNTYVNLHMHWKSFIFCDKRH